MADGRTPSINLLPSIQLRAPTVRTEEAVSTVESPARGPRDSHGLRRLTRRASTLRRQHSKHVKVTEPSLRQPAAGPSIYLGSYGKSPQRSRASLGDSVPPSPRASLGQLQLEHLLQHADAQLDTYGVEEFRDGFFDASFYRPLPRDRPEMMRKASETLPASFHEHHPLSLHRFLPEQWHEVVTFAKQISTTRGGVKLLRSFLGYYIAYIICLIPASRNFLGRFSYILVISATLNHAGRTVGSQLDGALMTIIGTFAGLGWGSLALYVSTSTAGARLGYGGVLAAFLVLFSSIISWLRCVYLRFFQAIICAGIAIFFTNLADTSRAVGWNKIFDYGIPWLLGQCIGLIVCIVVFPDAGSRPLAVALHLSLQTIQDGLNLPRRDTSSFRRDLAWNFVNLSQANRDFSIDISISRYLPEDIRSVRNRIQAVIRSVLAVKPDTALFGNKDTFGAGPLHAGGVVVSVSTTNPDASSEPREVSADAVSLVRDVLAEPTRVMIEAMMDAVAATDASLMNLSGYRSYLGPPSTTPESSPAILNRLKASMESFDKADSSIIGHPRLPPTYANYPEVVELFLFLHPVRQAADKVEALVQTVLGMDTTRGWKMNLPSYSFSKSLLRTNAQVRHDRGGATAEFYFANRKQMEETMQGLQSKAYIPLPHRHTADALRTISPRSKSQDKATGVEEGKSSERSQEQTLRYRLWAILHRLQGFETRFAFKVTALTVLLSIPAWLPQSRDWYNKNESWWSVVTVWIMMHPHVGGNVQDLAARTLCCIIGAVWGGFAYAADNGNPYVTAVFAALFMIPMLYRFTQSTHPRSGIMGCISFTVVSLSAYDHASTPGPFEIAWTRGTAFVVGVVAAVSVNWILWPFVARHELRKSISSMLLHTAIIYRGVVAKYIYYTEGEEPGSEDVARSEMLEARLREGFVRIRELMELTRHEIRLRAPFDPLPYSALIDACERFFERLVEVRQSSLYFQPFMLAGGREATESLIGVRRDAVATILMNLYILAGALRSDRPVPRYLPSAAAARKRLLERMEEVEVEHANLAEKHRPEQGRRWADVYQYAYSSALTDIVEQLQQLQRYTKEITGEVGFDAVDYMKPGV